MTKVFLIRHAESEGNLYRRAHGHYDGQITGRGFLQIKQLRKRFEHEKIDAVYSSDLSRTKTTAASVYEPRGLTLSTDRRLLEVNIGQWEDTPWGEIEHSMPEMCENFNSDPANWRVEGSEDYYDVRARMIECLTELAARHDGGTIAVFSHGFAIRTTLCGLLGIESHEVSRLPYCDNTAVALLHYDDDVLSVDYHGDNSHLKPDDSTFAHQHWWRSDPMPRHENMRYELFDDKRGADLFEQARREIRDEFGSDKMYTALLAGEPVGLIALETDKDSAEGLGWIEYMFIQPELRRRGLGVQLIGQAVSVYRKLGRGRICIGIPDDVAAVEFYLKYGFTRVGEERRPSGSFYLMEKDISRKPL